MIKRNLTNFYQALLTLFIALIVCSSCSKTTEDCIDDVAKNAKTESGVAVGVTNCRAKKTSENPKEPNITAKNSQKKCMFVWSDEKVNFEEIHLVTDELTEYHRTYIARSGTNLAEFRELEKQLIKAAESENHDLAKSIAKALNEKLITMYFKPHLTQEFIQLMAKDKNLKDRC